MARMTDAKRFDMAEGYLELELPREAMAELQKIEPAARSGFEWNYLMGESQRAAANHATALLYLEKAAARKPEEVSIQISLGWCLKRTGQLPRAIAALERALTICETKTPEDLPLVLYNLSCYCSLSGNTARAVQLLQRSLQLDDSYRRRVADEPDFDPIRNEPSFREVVERPVTTNGD